MHKRILLLGPTGVNKRSASDRLRSFLHENYGHEFNYVDFENDFLKQEIKSSAWISFLAQERHDQARIWKEAWRNYSKTIDSSPTILALHGCYVSSVLGLRCPINIPTICDEFEPDIVITLIDDVYNMWTRTEARADGQNHKGRPNLEQLLVARRAEQFVGDQIANHSQKRIENILFAAGNPIISLANKLIFDSNICYLSFPISEPRKMAAKGDFSFVDIINRAHILACEEMKTRNRVSFISPLSIDELPLNNNAKSIPGASKEDEPQTVFEISKYRWNLGDLWGDPENSLLPSLNANFTAPAKFVQAVKGLIKTDVGWRDRRLVSQSDALSIVCPKPPNKERITRGVSEEIETAVAESIVCRFWQNPEWDLEGFMNRRFQAAGSMDLGLGASFMVRVESLEQLIKESGEN